MPAITFTTRGALHKSALRHANERLILNAVRRNPGISRADVVRGTGLSPSSVTLIVNRLRRDGFLREEKLEARQQIGRQPIGLRLCPRARLAIGVDVDFSGATLLVGDLEDRVIERRKIPWADNLALFFDNVHAGVNIVEEQGQVIGPGDFSPLNDTILEVPHQEGGAGEIDIDADGQPSPGAQTQPNGLASDLLAGLEFFLPQKAVAAEPVDDESDGTGRKASAADDVGAGNAGIPAHCVENQPLVGMAQGGLVQRASGRKGDCWHLGTGT